MALYDDLMSPQNLGLFGLAGGLLEAGGPSRMPVSFGQALNRGGLQGVNLAHQGEKMQLLKAEEKRRADYMQAQEQAMRQKLAMEQQRRDALLKLIQGSQQPQTPLPQQALTAGAAVGDVGPTVGNAARLDAMSAQQPPRNAKEGYSPIPLGTLANLAAMEADIDPFLKLNEAAKQKLEFKDGIHYDKETGLPVRGGFGVSPTGQGYGMNVGPNGEVTMSGIPGSLQLQLAQARVGEQAKAERDPFLGQVDSQNRPIAQTREAFSQRHGTLGGTLPPPVGMGMTPGQKAAQVTTADVLSKGSSERWQKDYEQVQGALDSIAKTGEVMKHLYENTAVTGMGAELLTNLQRFKSQFMADQKAGKQVSDTQILEVLLGSDVFPMIGALGIGARGLDTPAEREFLKQVMTGTKEMDKPALLEMTRIRNNISRRLVNRWNEKVKSGELNEFFSVSRTPKKQIDLPKDPFAEDWISAAMKRNMVDRKRAIKEGQRLKRVPEVYE